VCFRFQDFSSGEYPPVHPLFKLRFPHPAIGFAGLKDSRGCGGTSTSTVPRFQDFSSGEYPPDHPLFKLRFPHPAIGFAGLKDSRGCGGTSTSMVPR